MDTIYGVIVENGRKVRRRIVLSKRKCLICETVFQPKTQKSVCCSLKCLRKKDYIKRKEAICRKSNAWYKNNLVKAGERRRKRYWSNPERFRKEALEWREKNPEKAKELARKTKDRLRHGGKRQELLDKYGFVCQQCGKTQSSYNTVAHHETFDATDHEYQTLLCRRCHKIIHK